MTDLLATGASGVRAYQTALTTTSENIANATTAGYHKRAATIEEVGRANSLRLGQTTKLTGNGSFVSGISRSADQFKEAEVRSSGSDLARTETGVVWLDRIESAMTGSQLSQRLTDFFNAAKGVAADPASSAPREVMLQSAASLATAFTATGAAMRAAQDGIHAAGQDAARDLNDKTADLVRVNVQLARGVDGSAARAYLLDERDRLLEGISAIVDTNVTFDDNGVATVRAGGLNGPVIADAEVASYVVFNANNDGTTSIVSNRPGAAQAINANGGAFAGITDGATKVAAALKGVSDIAAAFVTQMNQVQAQGRDLDGTAGAALFTVGANPTDLAVSLTDPRKIAAASVGEGVRGNGNMAALAAVRLSGGFETGIDDITTSNAAQLSARQTVAAAQTSIHAAAVTARDGVSSVDLDEEAVNLIRFQQAYQASSRVIQVAREILQTILDIR